MEASRIILHVCIYLHDGPYLTKISLRTIITFKLSFIKVIDNKAEIERLTKEQDALIVSISRREKLLSNENYVANAPEKIVTQERESLATEKEKLKVVIERLEQLK